MKHLIKIESVAHGVLGVRHAGLDQQYCEAGEQVILEWQPDAKWGLQEAHYTDGDNNLTAIEGGKFTMPNKDITIGGTFKRFVLDDWTGEVVAENVTAEGDVTAGGNVTVKGDVTAGSNITVKGTVTAEGEVAVAGDVTAEGNVTAKGKVRVNKFLELKDVASSEWCKVFVEDGKLVITPM